MRQRHGDAFRIYVYPGSIRSPAKQRPPECPTEAQPVWRGHRADGAPRAELGGLPVSQNWVPPR
jgi:hypothetical protein